MTETTHRCPECGAEIHPGRLLGATTTEAKARASRENGKLGGRPAGIPVRAICQTCGVKFYKRIPEEQALRYKQGAVITGRYTCPTCDRRTTDRCRGCQRVLGAEDVRFSRPVGDGLEYLCESCFEKDPPGKISS